MADANFFDPREDAYFDKLLADRARQAQYRAEATPEQAYNTSRMAATYPGMPAGAVVPLGISGVDPADPLAVAAAQQAPKVIAKKKSWLHAKANAVVRAGMTVAEAPFQFYSGAARYTGGAIAGQHGFSLGGLATDATLSTNLGVALTSINNGEDVDQGSGFFTNPNSRVGKEQAEITRQAWDMQGKGGSLGRIVANEFFEPEDGAYKWVEGGINLAGTLALDPVTYAGGGVAKIREARKLFKPVVDVTPQAEAWGFFKGHRKYSLEEQADEFLKGSTAGGIVKYLTDTNSEDWYDIWKRSDRKWDPAFAARMADTKDEDQIRAALKEQISQGKIQSKAYSTPFSPWKPGYGGVEVKRKLENLRMFNIMPGTEFVLEDARQSVTQLDAVMRNAKVSTEKIAEWTGKVARATDKEERRSMILDAMATTRQSVVETTLGLKRVGVDDLKLPATATKAEVAIALAKANAKYTRVDENVRKLTRLYEDTSDTLRRSHDDELGNNVPVKGVVINGEDKTTAFPQLLAESNDNVLPGLSREQVVEMRALTSKLAPILHAIDVPDRALRFATDKLWKPAVLLRAAYTVRVVGEEQIRMGASGLNSLANHPLAFISWVVADPTLKGRVPGLSKEWSLDLSRLQRKEGGRLGFDFGRGADDVLDAGFDNGDDAESALNQFATAMNREKNGDPWRQKRSMHGFVSVERGSKEYHGGLFVEHHQLRSDPIAQRVAGGFRPGDLAERTGNDIEDTITWFTKGGGQKFRKQLSHRRGWQNIMTDDEMAADYIRGIGDRIQTKTGGDFELRELIATGNINGSAAKLKDADALIARKISEGVGPQRVKAPTDEFVREHKSRMDVALDQLFDALMTKPTNYLSRSPAFRQFYWKRIEELLPSMTAEAQTKVLAAARKTKLQSKTLRRMEKLTTKGTGEIDLQNGDLLAKTHGLDETQRLLYSPTEKSQMFDMLHLIFPFGEAWKEVLSVWARIGTEDPTVLRKGQIAIEGARDTGFFATDPTTGEEVMTIPLTGRFNKAATGVDAPFQAPVKGLNIFSSNPFLPGLNPFLQIPLAKLIPNRPDYDMVREKLIPAGTPEVAEQGLLESFAPAWAKKMITAFEDPDTDKQLGSAINRIVQQKASSGEYGTSTQEEIDKLIEDSTRSGRLMFMMRAAAQFWAPSPPSPKWMAHDKNGDLKTIDVLLERWNAIKDDENISYDEAAQVFMDEFGEEAFLYMQPMSQGGFYPNEELHDFVRSNPSLAEKYPQAYGYFSPGGDGSKYSMPEQERQIAAGERESIPPRELVKLANARVAKLKLAQERKKFGDVLTDEQRRYLNKFKLALREDYKGYEPDIMTLGKTQERIKQLAEASAEPSMKNNNAAIAVRKYIEARDFAVEQDQNFMKTKRSRPLRDWIRDYGDALSAETPEFAPIWNDVLVNELEDDDTSDATTEGA